MTGDLDACSPCGAPNTMMRPFSVRTLVPTFGYLIER
jgi:hypothetical protein